ncbi:MAG: preprotein translocase subunit YajC [Chitinophagaceae bacterium]|nr:preprotein translocase subunit YajC [Chitinophagaceae bacterium]
MVGEGGKQNPMINVVFMVGMIGVMYFFLIRPQMKRAKEQKEFSNSTNVGDMIVTTAGIHGKIVKIDDGTLSLEVDRNTILKIDKSAVSMEMTAALRKKMDAAPKA